MKNCLKLFVAILICNISSFALFVKINSPIRTPAQNYQNVCAITSIDISGAMTVGGAGVIIDDNYVVTNRHVVDRNYSSHIESEELRIDCCFYDLNEIPTLVGGTVVSIGDEGEFYFNRDIAIVKLDRPMQCNTIMASDKSYSEIEICEEVYTLGCPGGRLPPHPTLGLKGPSVNYFYDRAGISAYYGNSGGGLFSKRTGELLGLTTHIGLTDDDEREIIPSFADFIKVNHIRSIMGKFYSPPVVVNYTKILISALYIGIILATAFGFRRHLFGS